MHRLHPIFFPSGQNVVHGHKTTHLCYVNVIMTVKITNVWSYRDVNYVQYLW